VLLAEHDEFRAASEAEALTADWVNTTTEIVRGASHFFIGRTDRLVDATDEWLRGLAASRRG
jgi:alpha/beta superfamily hydrolase